MCVNPTKEHGTKTKNTMQYTRLAKTLKHLVPSVILWLHHGIRKVPGKGVNLELQLPAYTTATATQDLSCICDLHHSSWQHRILNPLIEARDRTCNLMVPG